MTGETISIAAVIRPDFPNGGVMEVTFTASSDLPNAELDASTSAFSFYVSKSCGFGLSLKTASVGFAGDLGRIDVTSAPGCPWTSTGPAWITLSPTNGAGSGHTRFTIAANPLRATHRHPHHSRSTLRRLAGRRRLHRNHYHRQHNARPRRRNPQRHGDCNPNGLRLERRCRSGLVDKPPPRRPEPATRLLPSPFAPTTVTIQERAPSASPAPPSKSSRNKPIRRPQCPSSLTSPLIIPAPITSATSAAPVSPSVAAHPPIARMPPGARWRSSSSVPSSATSSPLPSPLLHRRPSHPPLLQLHPKDERPRRYPRLLRTTYCPDDPVTRGQMAAFLIRGRLNLNAKTPADTSFPYPMAAFFSDVAPGATFFRFIQKMKELGITTGCSTNTYCPDSPTTRGHLAVFLIRAFFTP